MDAAKLLKQATAHHQAGRLAPAQALYRQVLAADPNQADALHLLGVLAHQTGHASQAEALIRQAIARAPRAHPFHTSLGHVLRAQNRPAEAEAAYRIALRANPNAAENHHNLGLALREQSRAATAETAFRQALRLHRDFVAARIDLGNLLVEAGRPNEAEACLRAALRVAPTHHLVLNTLGLSLVAQDRHQDALAMFEQALAAAPGYPSATVNRANTLVSLEQLDAAASAFADAVRLVPDDLALRLAQARLELRLGHATQAERLLRDILQRAAGHPPALHELARVHAAQDRPDLALPLLEQVCRLMPENAAAWRELGLAYRDLARWPDALAPLAEAARLRPDDAGMRSDYAYALLANGQFAAAWPEFRWRTKRPGNVRLRQPEWDGAPTGKTVIVHAEQGTGDTLQFCRFIPQAARLARVVVACPPSLKRLLQTLPDVAELADGQPAPAFDEHCPLMSLPDKLAVPPERFAETVPYLQADAAAVAMWRERLAHLPGPRIGVVWAGNPVYPVDRKRSVPFAAIAPMLALRGASFVSLQVGETAAAGAGHFALDAAPRLADYADTAALIEALDLIIAVDTSVAHLAGALGQHVWLLNRADTDWRWLVEREDTPWYPSMRIFRQPTPGNWSSVLSKVVNQLVGVWGLKAPAGS